MEYMTYLLLGLLAVIFAYFIRLLWLRYSINRRLQEHARNNPPTHQVPYFIRIRDMMAQQAEQASRRAAELPPKYEDVYDTGPPPNSSSRSTRSEDSSRNESNCAYPGEAGYSNPSFAEEPPPDYSFAVSQMRREERYSTQGDSSHSSRNGPAPVHNTGSSSPHEMMYSSSDNNEDSLPYPPSESHYTLRF